MRCLFFCGLCIGSNLLPHSLFKLGRNCTFHKLPTLQSLLSLSLSLSFPFLGLSIYPFSTWIHTPLCLRMIILASLPLFSLLAYQILFLSGDAWVSSWVFFVVVLDFFFLFFPPPSRIAQYSHPGVWVSVYLQNIRSTSEPAGRKIHSCISITTFQTMGREKADGMEPPSPKGSMPGLFWTWKMQVRCWPRALYYTGRTVSVVRQLDLCSKTQSAIVIFFWSRWMLLLNKRPVSQSMVTSSSSFLFQP